MTTGRAVSALQVIDSLGMGGSEQWLMEVLRLWSKSGAGRMDFLTTGTVKGVFEGEAQALGARIHRVPYTRRTLGSFVRDFRRVLRSGRYDAIHDHQDYASGWHFLAGAGVLAPVRVAHVHSAPQIRANYASSSARRAALRAGKALVARYATHIAGTSRQTIVEHGFDEPRFDHIPRAPLHCGFDPARFRGDTRAIRESVRQEFGWPAGATIVLYAGRIDQSPDAGPQSHKNSGFAVSAGLACAKRDDGVRMILAGKTSPAVSVLEQRIAAAGCAGRFAFAGIRDDIDRLMIASDVLIFPSRGEGLGMVAVEAQAAGLPVLASKGVPRECVVVPELVEFRDVADGADAWGGALRSLMERRGRVADANERVLSSAFAIENSARALHRLYGNGVLT